MSDDRRWYDDPMVKKLVLILWLPLLGFCLWQMGNTYTDAKARLAAVEAQAAATDRAVVEIRASMEAERQSQRESTVRIETWVKGIQDRLDRLIERGASK